MSVPASDEQGRHTAAVRPVHVHVDPVRSARIGRVRGGGRLQQEVGQGLVAGLGRGVERVAVQDGRPDVGLEASLAGFG